MVVRLSPLVYAGSPMVVVELLLIRMVMSQATLVSASAGRLVVESAVVIGTSEFTTEPDGALIVVPSTIQQ